MSDIAETCFYCDTNTRLAMLLDRGAPRGPSLAVACTVAARTLVCAAHLAALDTLWTWQPGDPGAVCELVRPRRRRP